MLPLTITLLEHRPYLLVLFESTNKGTFATNKMNSHVLVFCRRCHLFGVNLPFCVKVVRVEPGAARECLQRLGGAAEFLLGDTRTEEEKIDDFGQMQNHDEGVVSGYAGGGDYGPDQFLETRGGGDGEIVPKIPGDVARDVIHGRVSELSQAEVQSPGSCWVHVRRGLHICCTHKRRRTQTGYADWIS